jgi:hypothetical protein
MRILLPAMAAATALTIGLTPAAAQSERHAEHERSRSHVSLHLSTHSVLKGNGLALRGRCGRAAAAGSSWSSAAPREGTAA